MNVSFYLLHILYGVVLDNTIRKQLQCTFKYAPFKLSK